MEQNTKRANAELQGVGIDLGTTNSVIAILNKKKNGDLITTPVLIPRAADSYSSSNQLKWSILKKTTLPSCVYYPQETNYTPIVGDFAKRQYALRPQLVAKSIKSQMGNEFTEGLAEEVPDKTPSEVSARILSHLLSKTEKMYCTDIKDAVITVPANFDPAMRGATLEAARLAGINTTNPDGTPRDDVLLSEPNAVICDLLNQIRNGEIPESVIDITEPKNVMVFDLGGGTLDVTLHNIRYSDASCTTIKIDEIATNRYTRLGGDDFDAALAEVMFERYLSQNAKYGTNVITQLKKERKNLIPLFLSFAETVKIDLSNSQNSDAGDYYGWGSDIEDEGINTGGNTGNGYSYDDNFSKVELETILEPFMGNNYTLKDYLRLESISDTKNIIYPILDVLKKASQKLETTDFGVDAVILNGGMSRFYMVVERLKEFFGLEPIVITDPDLAVARGAAVYHYYVREHNNILETEAKAIKQLTTPDDSYNAAARETAAIQRPRPSSGLDWGKSILNDALYLGLQNGAKEKELIPTGQELPYRSELMKGFKIDAGNQNICLPIRGKRIDGSIYTIARGSITLKQAYNIDTYVSFVVDMSTSKVMTMHAWICDSLDYNKLLEEVEVKVLIGNASNENTGKKKLTPPLGSILNPYNEMHQLVALSDNKKAGKYCVNASNLQKAKKLKSMVDGICSCGNRDEFARPVLDELARYHAAETRTRLFVIARRLCDYWTEAEKKELANLCMTQIAGAMEGFVSIGVQVNVSIQAIYTLGKVASKAQMNQVAKITNLKYKQAMLYAFANAGTNVEWIYDKFNRDVENVLHRHKNDIQNSAYALGTVLRSDLHQDIHFVYADKAVKQLCSCLNSYNLDTSEWVPVILAIGWICDQRQGNSLVTAATLDLARRALEACGHYSQATVILTAKSRRIALKLLEGNALDREEQQYLLKFVEGYQQ